MSVNAWLAPTVISSGIAGAVAMATHFSAQRAKQQESREDIRTEAFEQAKQFYTDVIARQEEQLTAMRHDVTTAMERAERAESSAETARVAVRSLRSELDSRDETISDLRHALIRREAND